MREQRRTNAEGRGKRRGNGGRVLEKQQQWETGEVGEKKSTRPPDTSIRPADHYDWGADAHRERESQIIHSRLIQCVVLLHKLNLNSGLPSIYKGYNRKTSAASSGRRWGGSVSWSHITPTAAWTFLDRGPARWREPPYPPPGII